MALDSCGVTALIHEHLQGWMQTWANAAGNEPLPVLWCLLCLQTPLLGHSGTTRGGRACPSVPRVPQGSVTSRNKVWCEIART